MDWQEMQAAAEDAETVLDWRPARFASRCRGCGGQVAEGEDCAYDEGEQGWICRSCGADQE